MGSTLTEGSAGAVRLVSMLAVLRDVRAKNEELPPKIVPAEC